MNTDQARSAPTFEGMAPVEPGDDTAGFLGRHLNRLLDTSVATGFTGLAGLAAVAIVSTLTEGRHVGLMPVDAVAERSAEAVTGRVARRVSPFVVGFAIDIAYYVQRASAQALLASTVTAHTVVGLGIAIAQWTGRMRLAPVTSRAEHIATALVARQRAIDEHRRDQRAQRDALGDQRDALLARDRFSVTIRDLHFPAIAAPRGPPTDSAEVSPTTVGSQEHPADAPGYNPAPPAASVFDRAPAGPMHSPPSRDGAPAAQLIDPAQDRTNSQDNADPVSGGDRAEPNEGDDAMSNQFGAESREPRSEPLEPGSSQVVVNDVDAIAGVVSTLTIQLATLDDTIDQAPKAVELAAEGWTDHVGRQMVDGLEDLFATLRSTRDDLKDQTERLAKSLEAMQDYLGTKS